MPEKVGCRKESYFLEFMYDDVARDLVGVVVHVLLDGAKGSHNHQDYYYYYCYYYYYYYSNKLKRVFGANSVAASELHLIN